MSAHVIQKRSMLFGIAIALVVFFIGSRPAAAETVVVYTSGSHVVTWDEIYPDPLFNTADWPSTAYVPVPAVGLDANW